MVVFMLDQITQLEERIEKLLSMLGQRRERIDELQLENERLRGQLDESTGIHSHNKELKNQVVQLEDELEGMADKEGKIRNRLRMILSKIDSIEQDLITGDEANAKTKG